MVKNTTDVRLLRRDGLVYLHLQDGREVPVRPVWARPISGRGGEVCFLDRDKREVLMLDSLDQLDEESRRVAEAELGDRYLIATITRVHRTEVHFGNRYWDVETDLGRRRFVMKDPSKHVKKMGGDHMIICDSLGNHYEIPSLSDLDEASRSQVDKVT